MVGINWSIWYKWTKVLVPLFSYALYLYFSSPMVPEKRYFLDQSVNLTPDHTLTHFSPLPDTLSSDTLYEVRAANGMPVYFFRKIETNVCFDNKCRLLLANVYWNITGRYLGLEFSEEEFLSKTDHEPFTESDYDEMNRLLADSLSLLAEYDFEDIVLPEPDVNDAVDGTTSATLPAIRDYVVEGAAYTTLKLWHIIHGPTKGVIEELTSGRMSEELILLLLGGGNSFDVVWTVSRLGKEEIEAAFPVQSAISSHLGENYSLTSSILQSLDAETLDSTFQDLLLQSFLRSDYGIRELIIDKLADIESPDEGLVLELVQEMQDIQGGLFIDLLAFVGSQRWNDIEIYRSLAELLTLPNSFLTGKVFGLLNSLTLSDAVVLEAMDGYRNKR